MVRTPALYALLALVFTLSGCQLISKTAPDETVAENSQLEIPPAELQPTEPEVQKPVKPVITMVTVKQPVIQTPTMLDGKLVLGFSEKVQLNDYGLTLDAKIDTGAVATSVDALNQELFERDGQKWVRFDLARTNKGPVSLERPIVDTIRIKRPGGGSQLRPVVSLNIQVGHITQRLNVSLNERADFDYPILIGRDFLKDMAITDVGKHYIAEEKEIKKLVRRVPIIEKHAATQPVRESINLNRLTVFGEIEKVKFDGVGRRMTARIDTGAETSSLDARDIKPFRRNGRRWVKFNLYNDDAATAFELPVTRVVRIKRHGMESERRYVISLNTTIGNVSKPTEFTLRDRSDYEYPILIGESFLADTALVDVAKEFTTEKSKRGAK